MLKRRVGKLLKCSIKVNVSFFHIRVKVFHVSCQSGQRVNCKCFCYFGANLPHHRERCAEISYIYSHDIADENSVIGRLQIGILFDVSLSGFSWRATAPRFLTIYHNQFFMIHASAVVADFDADKSSQVIIGHTNIHTIIALNSTTLNSIYA